MLRWVAVVAMVLATLPSCVGGRGSSGYELTAWFDKAVSLYEQSDVKILGLSAGTVDDIEVVGAKVRVRMTIDGDQPVPADVKATIVPLSLIGERYVQLFPAWTAGQPQAEPGAVIPVERTTVPTEPDEALAALKKFLDGLDPNATGRLVHNLAEDLDGNGQGLNDALRGLADLTGTFASKDAELVGIIEHFDRFTATLRTREQRLGQVMDQFATATKLLADERANVAKLVDALSRLSADGLDLVSEHGGRLDRDLTTLTRVLQSVRANIDGVTQLLDSTPINVAGRELDGTRGLAGAYDEKYHHLDLRNATSPSVAQFFDTIDVLQGTNTPCIEDLDVDCEQPSVGTPFSMSMNGLGGGGGLSITLPLGRSGGDDVPSPTPVRWLRRVGRLAAGAVS